MDERCLLLSDIGDNNTSYSIILEIRPFEEVRRLEKV